MSFQEPLSTSGGFQPGPVPPHSEDSGGGARFAYSMAALAYISVTGFVFNALLARMLPVEVFGHIRVIRTALDLWAIAAAFGLDTSAARAAGDLRRSAGDRRVSLVTHLWVALATSALVGLAGIAVFSWPGILRDPVAPGVLRWMSPLAPMVALYLCLCGHMQGRGWIRDLARAQAWRGTVLLAAGSALTAVWGLWGWAISRFVTEGAALAVAARAVWRGERPASEGGDRPLTLSPELAGARGALAYGGAIAVTQALAALISSIDILALDRFRADPREIAFYGVGSLIFTTALLIPQAFTQSQFHRIAATAHDGWKSWNLFVDYQGIVLVIVGPAALVLYALSPWIARIFGPEYIQAAVIFRWLIPAFFIWSAGIVATRFVAVVGRTRLYIAAMAITALAAVGLNVWLTPKYGAAGAVMSTTGAYTLLTLLAWMILLYNRSRSKPAGSAGSD